MSFSYSPLKSHRVLKSIILKNGNILELTTSWTYIDKLGKDTPQNKIDEKMKSSHYGLLENNIITIEMGEYISRINHKIILFSSSFFLSFILYFCGCIKLSRTKGYNIKENKLFLFIIVFTIINLLLLVVQFKSIYFNTIHNDRHSLSYLYLFATSLIFMNMPMLALISNKVNNYLQYDYLLLDGIKTYLKDRTQSVTEYKSIISFGVYPFFVIGNLPLGILLLLFWLPYAFIQFALFELRRWVQWLYLDESADASKDRPIKRRVNLAVIGLILFIFFVAISLIVGWPNYLINMMGLVFP